MVKGRMGRGLVAAAMTIFAVFGFGMEIPPDVMQESVSITASAAYENTHVNTGNQAEDIVAVAETQVGYHEGANNDTKYNRWNGTISGYPVNGYGYPWCQCFVSWCANQAGIPTSVIPRTAGTSTGKEFFSNRGLWQNSAYQGGSYTPKRGDIIYYSDSANVYSPSHVGIVTGCADGYVYTVEGNYSDSVKRRTIALSNSYIIGYGTPNYVIPDPNPEKPVLNVISGNSNTETVLLWNACSDTDFYAVRIYYNDRDEYYLYEEPYHETSFNVVLPAGEYRANVASVSNNGKCTFSDDVVFTVKPSSTLSVTPGNSSTDTIFNWSAVEGATEYDIKIWKDTLWASEAYLIEWGIHDTNWSTVLPEGTYYAYVDTRFDSDISMSNVVEIVVNKGCKLEVQTGNTSTETVFSWNKLDGATEYDAKIWKDTLWEGDPYLIEWSIHDNNWSTVLPEGTYYAYVDARLGSDIFMSNVVEIVVNKGCKLEVQTGNTSSETVFSWNELDGATEYDVKMWKDALWEGEPYLIEWSIHDTNWSTVLPEGIYYAYVDARSGSDIFMSNVVEVAIGKGTKATVSVGTPQKPTAFSWNFVEGAEGYEVKIWNGTYWVGDPYCVGTVLTENTFEILLPAGHYEAYVDTVIDGKYASMSNVLKFDVAEENIIIGDTNADGKVTTLDVIMLQKHILNTGEVTDWQAGDLNNDGILDVFDLALLKRMLTEKK